MGVLVASSYFGAKKKCLAVNRYRRHFGGCYLSTALPGTPVAVFLRAILLVGRPGPKYQYFPAPVRSLQLHARVARGRLFLATNVVRAAPVVVLAALASGRGRGGVGSDRELGLRCSEVPRRGC